MAAERKISTRLVVEGESQYKSSIANINRELKTLESALKLVDSNFKGQANTMAALEAKNKALNDVIAKTSEKLKTENAALEAAKAAKTKYADAAEAARKKLDELQKTTDSATKETEEYFKQVAVLQAEINKYEAAEQKAAAAIENHTTKANKAQVELNNLNGQLANNEKYLNEAKTSTDGCAKSIDEFGKQTEQAAEKSEEFGDKSTEAIDGLASALAAAGVAATLKEIADALIACVDASIDFESAMAGVAKTTDLSQVELAAMGEAIKNLTLTVPVTASEFAKIVEVAGQLGIENKNLMDFSTVMANLGVATNMTSDEAATMLAQFAAITGMDASGFGRLGSAIVALGNNFATNEKKITDMSQGIAGAGTNAKISEADILGLSAAVTSLGIETQAGGTSMSKLIMDMGAAVETGKGLTDWAKAAGMSAAEFAGLWGTDATAAISAFIGNLDNLDVSAEQMLSTLGITETRMVRMVLSLVNAEESTGLLTDALNTSNSAWEENTALTTEAETRYKTTESRLTMAKNAVQNLKIAVGDQLNPALQLTAGIGQDVTEWATDFVNANQQLVPVISAVVIGIGAFTVALISVAVILPKIKAAWMALQATLTAAGNSWMLIASAIAAVVAVLATVAIQAAATEKEIHAATQSVLDDIEAQKEAYANTVAEIDKEAASTEALVAKVIRLAETENKSAGEKALLLSLVEDLNEAVPDLNLAYDEMTGTLNMTAEEMRKVTSAMIDQARQAAQIERLTELFKEQLNLQYQLGEANDRVTEAQLAYNKAVEEHDYKAAQEATKALTESKEDVESLTEALTENAEAQAAATDAVNEFAAASGSASGATQELSASQAASAEAIMASLGTLKEAYTAAYDSALTNINNTISGFEEMAATVPADVQTVIDALDTQSDFIDTYMDNLSKAAEMGLDEGLIAALSDGSRESAEILAGIVEDGGEKVQELNEKFREVQQGKEDFATTVAEMHTNFTTEAGLIVDDAQTMVDELNLKLDAYTAGADTIQGYIDGLNSKLSEVNTILGNIGFSGGSTKPNLPKGESKAQGLDRVPYDGYFAMLHEDEMVLNRARASEYRAEQRARQTNVTNSNTKTVINHNSFFVPTKEAYDDIADYIDGKWGR